MIVSGVEYYGQIREITTSAVIPVAPTITTAAITSITQTSAVGGGNVTSEGTQSVTERGIVYSLATNPTIANTKIIDGSDGIFTSNLTSLNANTTYFVRAYAISSVATVYGDNVSFITLQPSPPPPPPPVHATLCMTFSHQTHTNPHSRIIANLDSAVGGMICIQEAHIEGYNAGNCTIISNTMGVSSSTCICFDGLSSNNCSAGTDQTPGDDACWTSATGYSYSAPAVKVNGTLIAVCGTTISVGSDTVTVNFSVSCVHF
jgi:hypothetical protein